MQVAEPNAKFIQEVASRAEMNVTDKSQNRAHDSVPGVTLEPMDKTRSVMAPLAANQAEIIATTATTELKTC